MTARPVIDYIDPAEIIGEAASLSNEEARALEEINRRVAAAESLDSLIDFVFEGTSHIFPCDRIALSFLEDNGRRITARLSRARYSPLLLYPPYSAPIAGTSLEKVLQSGEVRIINDLEQYLKIRPESEVTQLLVQEGARSSLTCPLKVEGRPVGFLFRNSRSSYAYSEHEVLLHALMADRLSQAVEKTLRIDQLTAANKNYMEMLAFASHELKSPLASISLECDMALDGFFGEIQEQQSESLRRIHSRARSLIDTTDDFLNLARFEGNEHKLNISSSVDFIADVIAPAAEMVAAQAREKSIEISLPAPSAQVIVPCDPRAMRTVLNNLLSNAVKYGRENGRVNVALDRSPDTLVCRVRNEGVGFPSEQKRNLFKRFSRLDVPEFKSIRGTGVGLYIVWRTIDSHGGNIWADSEYGKWAEFAFKLPTQIPRPLFAQ